MTAYESTIESSGSLQQTINCVAAAANEKLPALLQPQTLGWWDSLARQALFKMLKQIKVGFVVVEEQGRRHEFGDAKATLQASVKVHHQDFYSAVLSGGSIGAGEAYMQGLWSSPLLVDVVRVMSANLNLINAMDSRWGNVKSFALKSFHWLRANTLAGSRKNIAAHYDLGNEFFALFLDKSMMYSAAIFADEQATLEQASFTKLDRICQRLLLNENDHLLEIGTGWGGMAIHAAKYYGCRVTTTTISQQQYDYAKAAVERAGVSDKVTLLLQDYRELEGHYDKLVSIEMIEAVGHRFYPDYFTRCAKLLKPDGLMLIQAITIADQRFDYAANNVDFIQRYIFPGGALPSVSVIADCLRNRTDMQMVGLEEIGIHYATTLAHWRQRFLASIAKVRQQGFDQTFIRMWDYYLCYCEGGFRERAIGTAQILMAKPQAKVLPDVGC